MTHHHKPFEHERIDDEIDVYSRGADSELPVESPEARLLTDLRRVYGSAEEDARSLDRVYARLHTHERTHERGRGAEPPVANTAFSSRLTQKGWHGINTATDTSSP